MNSFQSFREVKYLYDGDCAMCRSLKAVLERQDNRQGVISFIDISGGKEDKEVSMTQPLQPTASSWSSSRYTYLPGSYTIVLVYCLHLAEVLQHGVGIRSMCLLVAVDSTCVQLMCYKCLDVIACVLQTPTMIRWPTWALSMMRQWRQYMRSREMGRCKAADS